MITVRSRRGEVAIHVRRDDGTPSGAVFIPFAYYEAAANLLTNAALDPFGKIPEFKYCAVRVHARRQADGGGRLRHRGSPIGLVGSRIDRNKLELGLLFLVWLGGCCK